MTVGDINARIGNKRVENITEEFRKPVINKNGYKWIKLSTQRIHDRWEQRFKSIRRIKLKTNIINELFFVVGGNLID